MASTKKAAEQNDVQHYGTQDGPQEPKLTKAPIKSVTFVGSISVFNHGSLGKVSSGMADIEGCTVNGQAFVKLTHHMHPGTMIMVPMTSVLALQFGPEASDAPQ